MPSVLASLRERVPWRLRDGARRLLRFERVVQLELPTPPRADGRSRRALTIRTSRGNFVNRLLAASGLPGYDPDTLACFLAAVETRGSRPVFDVGANIGIFSWLAAALTPATVVAFEPTPEIHAQLRAICALNDLKVRVERIALGAAPGTARLYISEQTDSSNSLREGFRPSHRAVAVTVETLDRYARTTGTIPAVIKVDTEATEPDVLRGAIDLLATSRPWIICEVLAGRTEADLTAILEPFGYRWYRIDGPGPLEPRSVIEGDSTYRHLNWLFTPEEPAPAFWQALGAWRASIAGIGQEASSP